MFEIIPSTQELCNEIAALLNINFGTSRDGNPLNNRANLEKLLVALKSRRGGTLESDLEKEETQ